MTIKLPEGFTKTKARAIVADLVYSMGPISGHEIGMETGMARASVSRIMKAMHKANLVYIHSWTHPGNSNALAPVWAWRTRAGQHNAQRPPPLTQTEINIRWNARHSARRSAYQKAKRGTKPSIWAGLL